MPVPEGGLTEVPSEVPDELRQVNDLVLTLFVKLHELGGASVDDVLVGLDR